MIGKGTEEEPKPAGRMPGQRNRMGAKRMFDMELEQRLIEAKRRHEQARAEYRELLNQAMDRMETEIWASWERTKAEYEATKREGQ